MRNNTLLAASAFVALAHFVSPAAWASSCHDEGQSSSDAGAHQCQQACSAKAGNSDQHANEDKSEHACKQSDKDGHGAGVGKVMDSYFAILASLSQNSMDNVGDNAKALAEGADGLIKQCADCKGDSVKACSMAPMADVSAAAKSLAEKTDIDSARTEFGALSEKLVELQGKHAEGSDKLAVYRCDMAKKVWLQENEDPGNPYLGPSMATCRRKLN